MSQQKHASLPIRAPARQRQNHWSLQWRGVLSTLHRLCALFTPMKCSKWYYKGALLIFQWKSLKFGHSRLEISRHASIIAASRLPYSPTSFESNKTLFHWIFQQWITQIQGEWLEASSCLFRPETTHCCLLLCHFLTLFSLSIDAHAEVWINP